MRSFPNYEKIYISHCVVEIFGIWCSEIIFLIEEADGGYNGNELYINDNQLRPSSDDVWNEFCEPRLEKIRSMVSIK